MWEIVKYEREDIDERMNTERQLLFLKRNTFAYGTDAMIYDHAYNIFCNEESIICRLIRKITICE